MHFKKCFGKYFLMFGCVLENTLENTFYTCCSHFLTFSRLPNEYIISFIPQNTNKTQKKNHQIRTNEVEIAIGEIAISIDAIAIVLSLSLAAFVRLLCFVVFWLSVFLSFALATEIV